jgi:hypothetical protein
MRLSSIFSLPAPVKSFVDTWIGRWMGGLFKRDNKAKLHFFNSLFFITIVKIGFILSILTRIFLLVINRYYNVMHLETFEIPSVANSTVLSVAELDSRECGRA